jgi:hypothetical protein
LEMGEGAGSLVFDLYDKLFSKTISICKASEAGCTVQTGSQG